MFDRAPNQHASVRSATQILETDPVCAMQVSPSNAAATELHDGRTFYFCGQGRAAKFIQDPQKYLPPTKEGPKHFAGPLADHT